MDTVSILNLAVQALDAASIAFVAYGAYLVLGVGFHHADALHDAAHRRSALAREPGSVTGRVLLATSARVEEG